MLLLKEGLNGFAPCITLPWCCSLRVSFPWCCSLYNVSIMLLIVYIVPTLVLLIQCSQFPKLKHFLSCRVKQVYFNQYSSVTAEISAFSTGYMKFSQQRKRVRGASVLAMWSRTDLRLLPWLCTLSLSLTEVVLEVMSSHFSVRNKNSDVYIAASLASCIRLLFTRWSSLHIHNEDILCYRMTWHRKERTDRITIQTFLIDFHINT